jgi:hypothetical protein
MISGHLEQVDSPAGQGSWTTPSLVFGVVSGRKAAA